MEAKKKDGKKYEEKTRDWNKKKTLQMERMERKKKGGKTKYFLVNRKKKIYCSSW